MTLSVPVAGGKLHEQIAIEVTCSAEVGVLDLGVVAKSGGAGPSLHIDTLKVKERNFQ